MAIKIVQAINLANYRTILEAAGTIHANELCYFLTTNYNGTISYYFEAVVALYTTNTAPWVRLYNNNGDILASITDKNNNWVRRRAAITPTDSYPTYHVAVYADWASGGVGINAARILILQNAGASLTATETQIEIGSYQEAITASAYAALTYPKYWLYTAANWDGTKVFSAEVVYACSSSKGPMYARLEEDDGAFANWAEKVVIVSAGNGTVPIRVRVTFTPTDGRNYRIAVYTTGSKTPPNIYCGKIVVTQTGTITKLETVQTVLDRYFDSTGYLTDSDIYYDPAEWDGVTKTFYHEHDAPGSGTNTSKLQSDPNGTPADIANSSITGTNRTRGGTALTMPGTAKEIDTYLTAGALHHSKLIAIISIVTGTTYNESVTLAASVGVSPAPKITFNQAVTLGAGAGVSDTNIASLVASASFPATASISPTPANIIQLAATLAATAEIANQGGLSFGYSITLDATAGLSPDKELILNTAVTLPASTAMIEAANAGLVASVSFPTSAGVGMSTTIIMAEDISLAAAISILNQAGLAYAAALSLDANAGLTPVPNLIINLDMSLAARAGLSDTAFASLVGAISLPASTTIGVSTALIAATATALAALVGVSSQAGFISTATAVLAAVASITPDKNITFNMTTDFGAEAGLSLANVGSLIGSINLSSTAAMDITPAVIMEVSSILSALASISSTCRGIFADRLTLQSSAAVLNTAGLTLTVTIILPASAGINTQAAVTITALINLLSSAGFQVTYEAGVVVLTHLFGYRRR